MSRPKWMMILGLTLGTITLASAGQVSLEFAKPEANPEAKAKSAVVVVRMVGCHDAAKAKYTITAEGLVNGERKSVPLTAIALSEPGTYAIKREWPASGSWVLKIRADNEGALVNALVPIQRDNSFERKTITIATGRDISSQEVDSALRALGS